MPERIFGFGAETPDIELPDFLEIPLERGDSIGFYAMWNNQTDDDLHGVFVHLALPYATGGGEREPASVRRGDRRAVSDRMFGLPAAVASECQPTASSLSSLSAATRLAPMRSMTMQKGSPMLTTAA